MRTRQGPAEPQTHAPLPAAGDEGRAYLLERVGEAAIVQLYADGFEALPACERILVWHLAEAAIAGRDIYFDQRYAHNLEMRELLEALVPDWPRLMDEAREAVIRYTARACPHVPGTRSIRCSRACGRCSSTGRWIRA